MNFVASRGFSKTLLTLLTRNFRPSLFPSQNHYYLSPVYQIRRLGRTTENIEDDGGIKTYKPVSLKHSFDYDRLLKILHELKDTSNVVIELKEILFLPYLCLIYKQEQSFAKTNVFQNWCVLLESVLNECTDNRAIVSALHRLKQIDLETNNAILNCIDSKWLISVTKFVLQHPRQSIRYVFSFS